MLTNPGNAAAALISGLLFAAGSGQGHAAVGSDQVNATGACNGALPAYETTLRKRPLAIANEGDSTAFVSCSLQTSGIENLGYFDVVLVLINRGSEPAQASCTLVTGGTGDIDFGNAGFFPQTAQVPGNGLVNLVWWADAFEVDSFDVLINFTCALPPDVEIGSIGGAYEAP